MSELEVIEGDLRLGEIDSAETVAETAGGEILQLGNARVSVGTDAAKQIRALFNDGLNPPSAVPDRLQLREGADGDRFYYDPETGEELSISEARSAADFSRRDTVDAINDATAAEIAYGGETTETEVYAETIKQIGDEVQVDDGILGDLRRLGTDAFEAERAFTTNAPGNTAGEYSISLYDSGERSDLQGSIMFEDAEDAEPFLSALSNLPEGVDPSAALEGSAAIDAATDRSRERREIIEAAREQIEADPDTSLDEVSVGARVGDDGPAVIFQDPETNETESINLEDTSADAAADAVGSFDPSAGDAGGSTSPTTTGGDGLDRRVIAAGAAVIGLAAVALGGN